VLRRIRLQRHGGHDIADDGKRRSLCGRERDRFLADLDNVLVASDRPMAAQLGAEYRSGTGPHSGVDLIEPLHGLGISEVERVGKVIDGSVHELSPATSALGPICVPIVDRLR
jgi:hypothetical protein